MNKFERQYCEEITNKYLNHDLANPFSNPVDELRDHAVGYYKMITNPMDLRTLHDNLINNKYQTCKEWKEDLLRIWANAILYNKKQQNAVYFIAQILQKEAERDTEFIPRSQNDIWFLRLRQAALKVEEEINKNSRSSSKSRK